MSSLQELIAKLEAAKEGSREFDAIIALSIGLYRIDPIHSRMCMRVIHRDGTTFESHAGKPWWEATSELPFFTTSLDAALSLVPAKYSWHCYAHPARGEAEPEPRSYADVYLLGDLLREGDEIKGRHTLSGPFEGEGPTAAIAIVIAALKARAS